MHPEAEGEVLQGPSVCLTETAECCDDTNLWNERGQGHDKSMKLINVRCEKGLNTKAAANREMSVIGFASWPVSVFG